MYTYVYDIRILPKEESKITYVHVCDIRILPKEEYVCVCTYGFNYGTTQPNHVWCKAPKECPLWHKHLLA
jgi:sugar phosphate isomerase/epimerase